MINESTFPPRPYRLPIHRVQYKKKGEARMLGLFTITNANYDYAAEKRRKERDAATGDGRMMARTEILPIYTIDEFNYKVGCFSAQTEGGKGRGGCINVLIVLLER